MRFNLDAVGLEGQTQAQGLGCLDHFATEGFPVEVRPGSQMRVVIAHGAVHLGQQPDVGDLVACCLQAQHHVGNFLANGGRTGGLTVRTTEHGNIGKGMCHVA